MDAGDTLRTVVVRGEIDSADTRGVVRGWCWSPQEPDVRRTVALLLDDRIVADARCDQFREDLLLKDMGDGRHAFTVHIPESTAVVKEDSVVTLLDLATGTQVKQVRATLPLAAPAAVARQPPPSIFGHLDLMSVTGIVSGWCWDASRPDWHATVEIVADGKVIGTVVANGFRNDLRQAAIGRGDHGLRFALPRSVLTSGASVRVTLRETASQTPVGDPSVLRGGTETLRQRMRDLERRLGAMQAQFMDLPYRRQAKPALDWRAALGRVAALAANDAADGDTECQFLQLAVPEEPAATVCLEAGGSPDQVCAEISALQQMGVDRDADLVLIDDGQLPEMALLPGLIGNLGHVRLAGPHRLLAGRHQAALAARGALVVFLAGGVRMSERWLDHVRETFRQQSRAAIVGTRVIRDDGCLHHLGLNADKQGNLHDVHQSDDPDAVDHRVMQEVGAVGDYAFAVRSDVFRQVGGFDLALGTTGAAVVDLCARVRAAGWSVICQPSAVAHLSDLGRKSNDRITAPAVAPGSQPPPPWQLWVEQARPGPGVFAVPVAVGRALVIDTSTPRPDQDAGSIATREQMLVLRRLGYHVTFAAIDERPGEDTYRAALERAGIHTIGRTDYASVTDYLDDAGRKLDLIVIHRYHNLQLFSAQIADLAPKARIVFIPCDLHYLREQRRMALGGDVDDTLIEELRQQELACLRRSDATILPSDIELALASIEIDRQKLHLLRWIGRPHPPTRPFAERTGLCFLANFEHSPNEDGLLWFVQEILPLLTSRLPDVVLHVAGSCMSARVTALASPQVVIHGWVADLAPLFESVRVAIAPIRYGAGFKGKVATSLLHGVPVVATTIALEGMGLLAEDGVLCADTPEGFADEVVRLYGDAELWARLSARAIAQCEAFYSETKAAEVYQQILTGLGLPVRPPGG